MRSGSGMVGDGRRSVLVERSFRQSLYVLRPDSFSWQEYKANQYQPYQRDEDSTSGKREFSDA